MSGMKEMSVNEIREAIRIAEAAGDTESAKQLRKRLQQHTLNEG